MTGWDEAVMLAEEHGERPADIFLVLTLLGSPQRVSEYAVEIRDKSMAERRAITRRYLG